jgi:hypothetical protein
MNRQVYTEIPVVFEDVRFHRATNIPKEGKYCGAVGWSFMVAVMQVGSFIHLLDVCFLLEDSCVLLDQFYPKILSRDSLFQYKLFS